MITSRIGDDLRYAITRIFGRWRLYCIGSGDFAVTFAVNFTLLFILAIYLARAACRTELTRYFDRISAEMKQVKLVWSIQLLCGKFRGRCCCVTSGLTLTIILVIFIPIGDLLMRPILIALMPLFCCWFLQC